jgi:putative ABC transport system permease protein
MNKLPVFKDELLKNPNILGVTSSLSAPGTGMYMDVMYIEGEDKMEEELMTMLNVDEDYINVMQMDIVEGRNFDRKHSTDRENAVLINQTAAAKFGWDKNVLGRQIFRGHGKPNKYKVIGVVKDFHFKSLHEKISPVVFFLNEEPNQFIGIRIAPSDKKDALVYIENKWKQFNPDSPWEYTFLEEMLAEMYNVEDKLEKLIGIFALISIFISLLGIFGLSSFITEQLTREISIRKVFGASAGSIIYKLSKDFIRLVIIAFLIASPIAWYVMNYWLESFPYRISIQAAWLVMSGVFVMVVAELTMIFQALNAAYKNPVHALKYE